MKNSKEMQAILIAIYCINLTSNEDKDVTNLREYAIDEAIPHRYFLE